MAQHRKLSRSPRAKQPTATPQTVIVIEHPAQQSMAEEIEDFLAETGMLPTHFGRDAMRDPRFVSDMRKGRRELLPRTANKVRSQMAFYRRFRQFADPRSVSVDARLS